MDEDGARHAKVATPGLQPFRELVVKQRIEHNSRRGLDLAEHPIKLLVAANQRVDVLDRRYGQVLRRGRTCHRGQRLAGGIRKQVKVKVAARAVGHHRLDLWIGGEQAMPARFAQVFSPPAGSSPPPDMHSRADGRAGAGAKRELWGSLQADARVRGILIRPQCARSIEPHPSRSPRGAVSVWAWCGWHVEQAL